jgi:predicted membrane channel-forming protein YqfA (hemolysin III family)
MNKRTKNRTSQKVIYPLAGWILFIICAIFFIASSLKNHDTLTFIGSVIFLIACIVFLVPLVRPGSKRETDAKIPDDKKNR